MNQPGIAQARRSVRVGLLGMYASANLGDTAIQTVVMRALLRRKPELEFVALCTDPADAARTFGLQAYHVSGLGPAVDGRRSDLVASEGESPWLRAPVPIQLAATAWHVHRIMRGLDMLLISGSGQIDDFWGGPWQQPYRLLAWARAARRQGKPVAFFGVGVDQLLTRRGKRLVRAALDRAQLRVVRDAGSLKALRDLGLEGPCDVCPDPAFQLGHRREHSDATPDFAVVSPIARSAWPGASDAGYQAYLSTLAAAVDHLQARGLAVRFVCSQIRMDPPVVASVRTALRSSSAAVQTIPVTNIDEYIKAVSGARVVIGSRLHALILALVAGTPVIGISYARKVEQQMRDAGLAAHCLDLATLRTPDMLHRIDIVLGDQHALRRRIADTVRRFDSELTQRFDRLAELVPSVLVPMGTDV